MSHGVDMVCSWGFHGAVIVDLPMGSAKLALLANAESVESVPCSANAESVESVACSAYAESKENARPTKKVPINGPKLPTYGEMRVMGRESIGLAFSR